MIRSETLGELKDGAAGLVALSELLGSRRISPRAIPSALVSASEGCAGVVRAVSALALEVIAVANRERAAAEEIRAAFDRAVTYAEALRSEIDACASLVGDARTRLALERAAHAATSHVWASLFLGELFLAVASPRTVSIRVADVLGFGPVLAEGPNVIRATLDVPAAPIATTDARLLRALVELSVQLVVGSGVSSPHVSVTTAAKGGARVRVGFGPSAETPKSTDFGRRGSKPPPAVEAPGMFVRRLPWSPHMDEVARAAGRLAGVSVAVDPNGQGVTTTFE